MKLSPEQLWFSGGTLGPVPCRDPFRCVHVSSCTWQSIVEARSRTDIVCRVVLRRWLYTVLEYGV
jgi:hypothetical protein